MKISAIICTYNRCRDLATVLESLLASRVPDGTDWEILVVDNNSTDKTRQVVDEFSRRNPARIRYLFESQQGLSCARNAGIRASHGEIVAFTDDDTTVEPHWLWNLTSNLQHGEWVGSGGRIVPIWPGPIPTWLSTADPDTMGPFAAFDMGPEPDRLTRPPYGGNMAFRTEVFKKYGDFRTDLGRSGTNLQGREDLELANRLLAAGELLSWEPAAVVHHPVAKQRMTRKYVLKWWYWYGRSEVVEVGAPDSRWKVLGVPLFLFRRIIRWALQSLITFDPPARFACQRRVCSLAGTLQACYQSRQRKHASPEAPSAAVPPTESLQREHFVGRSSD